MGEKSAIEKLEFIVTVLRKHVPQEKANPNSEEEEAIQNAKDLAKDHDDRMAAHGSGRHCRTGAVIP